MNQQLCFLLSQKIQTIRKVFGMNRRNFCKSTGVNINNLNRVEAGDEYFSIQNCRKIIEVLSLSTDELLLPLEDWVRLVKVRIAAECINRANEFEMSTYDIARVLYGTAYENLAREGNKRSKNPRRRDARKIGQILGSK